MTTSYTVNPTPVELNIFGSNEYPRHSASHGDVYLPASVLDVYDINVIMRHPRLAPILNTLQDKGVENFIYIDGNATLGEAPYPNVGEVLRLLVAHLYRHCDSCRGAQGQLPIIFHIENDCGLAMRSQLSLNGFVNDPSLDNVDAGLKAYTREV